MSYFNNHLDAIEIERGAVWSEDMIMIKTEAIETLHHFFANIPDSELSKPLPSIEDFITELKYRISN